MAVLAAALLPVREDLGQAEGAHVVVALSAADVLAVLAALGDRHAGVRVLQLAAVAVVARRLRGADLAAAASPLVTGALIVACMSVPVTVWVVSR